MSEYEHGVYAITCRCGTPLLVFEPSRTQNTSMATAAERVCKQLAKKNHMKFVRSHKCPACRLKIDPSLKRWTITWVNESYRLGVGGG